MFNLQETRDLYYELVAKTFAHLLKRQVTNAKPLAEYIRLHFCKTPRCTQSVYTLKQGLPFHVFSSEMARALRRAGYIVTLDDMTNARETECFVPSAKPARSTRASSPRGAVKCATATAVTGTTAPAARNSA